MSSEKVPERPKRLLPMQSFKEAELSDELHKALTKRQNIINSAPKETKNNSNSETTANATNQENNNFQFNLKPVVSQKSLQNNQSQNVNSQPPWASEVKHFSNKSNQESAPIPKPSSSPPKSTINQKAVRKPSLRGPKPPPPKRTCSLSESEAKAAIETKNEPLVLEEPIDEDTFDLDPPVDDTSVGLNVRSIAAMLEPHQYTTPVQVVGRRSRSNSTKTPTTPLSPMTDVSDDAFVFPKPSDFKKTQQQTVQINHQEVHQKSSVPVPSKPVLPHKPQVQSKPSNLRPSGEKPHVFKKPTLKVHPNTHKPVPQTQKLSFDLSVLDNVEKNRNTKLSPKVLPLKQNSQIKEELRNDNDDFDWPAPPPEILATPTPEVINPPSQPQLKSQTPTPSSIPVQNTSPRLPQPQSMRTPPTEPKTCFEKDDDQGTVKRRPNSYTRAAQPQTDYVAERYKAPPLPPKDQLPPTTKAATNRRMSELDNILHEINSEIAICSSQSSTVTSAPISNNCPILPPKQASVKSKMIKAKPQIAEEKVIFEDETDSPGIKNQHKTIFII